MIEREERDELDELLEQNLGAARVRRITPSPQFVAGVMDRIRDEAVQPVAPPPIAFPWRRAIPAICAAGLVGCLCVAMAVSAGVHAPAAMQRPIDAASTTVSYPVIASYIADALRLHLGWLLLGLLVALLPLPLSQELVEHRQEG